MLDEMQKTVGDKIRQRRQELGWTIGELAELSNADPGTISRTERGKTSITLRTSVDLCRALRIDLRSLVGGDRSIGLQVAEESLAYTAGSNVSGDQVKWLLALYRADPMAARKFLAEGLNRIVQEQVGENAEDFAPVFDERMIRLLLRKQDFLLYRIAFPPACVIWAVPVIYTLGGTLTREDLKLYLSAIFSEDSPRNQRLDRQSKDVVRRLQSDTPDRVRLVDLLKLEGEAGINLVDLYWKAEEGNDWHEGSRGQEEAAMISMFVKIHAWFESTGVDKANIVQVMRIVDPGPVENYHP